MRRIEPRMKWNLGTLIDRPNRDAERLLARVAPIDARAGRFALEQRGFANDATVRANRAIWPKQAFKMPAGCVGVGEA